MEIPSLYVILIVIVACIFSIASSAIGVQSFNDNPVYKESKKSNFGFVVVNLIVSIVVILLAFAALFLKLRASRLGM